MTQEDNRKISVLIVEDEPILGIVCSRILKSTGYSVELAPNGLVAKDMLQKTHYDICLSDIRTPVMNGIELYKYVKENFPELAENTLFMTGDVLSKEIKSFLEENETRFILKPFTDAQLKSAIDEIKNKKPAP